MLGTTSEALRPTYPVHSPLTAAFIDPPGGLSIELTTWLGNEGVLTGVWNDADTFLRDPARSAFPVIFVLAADYQTTGAVVRVRAALGGVACQIYQIGLAHAADEQKHKNGLADDYLPVSWPFVEFLHKIERASAELMPMADDHLAAGAVQLNHELRCLIAQGRSVPIKPAEYRLLYYLLRHAGETVTCVALHKAVWPDGTLYSKGNVQKLLQRVRSRVAEVYGFSLVESVGTGIYRVTLAGTPS